MDLGGAGGQKGAGAGVEGGAGRGHVVDEKDGPGDGPFAGGEGIGDVAATGGGVWLFGLGAGVAGAAEGSRFDRKADQPGQLSSKKFGLIVAAGASTRGVERDGDDGLHRGRPRAQGLVKVCGHGWCDGGDATEFQREYGLARTAVMHKGRAHGIEAWMMSRAVIASIVYLAMKTARTPISVRPSGELNASFAEILSEFATTDAARREDDVEGAGEDSGRAQGYDSRAVIFSREDTMASRTGARSSILSSAPYTAAPRPPLTSPERT